ncbi:OmpH family outer membrane protein [Sunxiuqinia indica]|uniref:OmpH family outer membrane protein n=1 Tax=Sunxiuqinia indica TaxID=2692584 RepID=UPI00135AF831|nr:OmpH family outer membrane protein [Sunxiuqinia indica]
MMKTTTKTSRTAVILSWAIALIGCIGLVLFLWLLPTPEKGAMRLQDKYNRPVRNVGRRIKKEQSQRALPPDYARQLVKQSEVLIKKDLETRLKKFQEMSEKMRQRKDGLLEQVEKRQLPPSAPDDANNTSVARNIPRAGSPPLASNPTVKDLYDMLKQYEVEIQRSHLASIAAKQSLSKGLSFPEVYNSLQLGSSFMPDFDELIRNQTNGQDWNRSLSSNTSGDLEINNTADLNNYRGLLGQTSRQAGLAGARLESLFGVPNPGGKKPDGGSNYPGEGSGSGDGGMEVNFSNTGSKTPMSHYQGGRLDQEMVKAQALSGRRVTKQAERKGWLYINTWYMIGPWENYGRDDFAIVHPPEISIDFDAVYTDGQVGQGTAETDSDPLKMIGEEVELDGTLRWNFMQSESMHNTVPVTTGHSTYYAYTELYFDEPATMLVAIGTDDSGRVWINGKDVWQDRGTSWYYIDESMTLFQFRQGWNRVLVRLENSGGGPAGFSLLICPPEAVSSDKLDK